MTGARGRLIRRQSISLPLAEVAAYFEDPRNLQHLTPGWLGFRILEVPEEPLKRGSRIRYRLRLFGLPLEWHTLIERSDPGRGFVDTQTAGPYRSWVHTHTFSPRAGGVLMEDRVDYELPFGPLGLLAAPLVRVQLAAIFRYRRKRVERLAARAGPGHLAGGPSSPYHGARRAGSSSAGGAHACHDPENVGADRAPGRRRRRGSP